MTEQARHKVLVAGEVKDPNGDVDEWAGRFPPDRAEVASVRVADTRFPMLSGSHAIKRLAPSVERR